MTLANSSIFNGDGYTITLDSTNINGIFQVTSSGVTTTVQNLLVDADAVETMTSAKGVILNGISTTSIDVTIENCGVIGTFGINGNGGAIIGRTESTSSGTTTI